MREENLVRGTEAGEVALPFTPAFVRDPYPTYEWLRREHPCFRMRFPFAPDVDVWLVSRYTDARLVLTSRAVTNDPDNATTEFRQAGLAFAHGSVFGTRLDTMDPPRHAFVQRYVRAAFAGRRMARLSASVQKRASSLIWSLGATGECELISDFCEPLVRGTLAEFLGLAPEELVHTRELIVRLVSADQRERALWRDASASIEEYLKELVERKLRAPDGSLLSTIAKTSHLCEDERLGLIFLLVAAGYESAMNFVANALLALCRFRGKREVVLRPDGIETALDELLRFDGPTATGVWRFTRGELMVGGRVLPPGAAILPLIGAANRDPEMFYEPDVLHLRRSRNPHLAFGAGIHRCPGFALAKALARTAIPEFVRRFPQFGLAAPFDDLRYRETLGSRAVHEARVVLR